MTSIIVQLLRDHGGEAALSQLLRQAGSARPLSYLEDTDNWVSQEELLALLRTAAQLTDNPYFATQVGEQLSAQHAGTQVATLLRSLGSVEAVLQAAAQAAGRFTTTNNLEALEVAPGRATIRAVARDGFTRHTQTCEVTSGLLSGAPRLFGLPQADVEESECQACGDAQCLFTVTWNAEQAAVAADPQQRVTALEGQLGAMSERLHNVYAIASDLVSTDDLDTVLTRIVERAASAVRAPSYILAVHAAPDAELQVYSRGIEARQAREFAEEANVAQRDTTIVAEVTSSRRHYGRLIARYPAKVGFFRQEQEMLDLYAKHAAAVLDIATALQESAERNAQVSSLLSLAHAVAQAGTSQEVGERLTVAVPQVVDCDRIAVWQWDETHECLRFLTGSGQSPNQQAAISRMTIRREDTPSLGEMISEPKPRYFDRNTDDRLMSRLMVQLEMAALVLVPIIAHDVFLGLLIVVVEDEPQRLRPDAELLQQLTGVAAVAAPAIQSGLLVDELHHEASHDSLTGLLNRVGFRQQIDHALAGGDDSQAQVGLLFVDLDGFKHVNDTYGHDFGDELLRQAAARLVNMARGSDEVARLGGDEFAVILSDVDHDDQLRRAERRVRAAFSEPFQLGSLSITIGASVGGGVWHEDGDTVADLVRHADAAMYADKARTRHEHVLLTGTRADSDVASA